MTLSRTSQSGLDIVAAMAILFPRQGFAMPEYDSSQPEGGNPLAVDVNAQYEGYTQHWVYQILMAFFVFLIIPGLGKSESLPEPDVRPSTCRTQSRRNRTTKKTVPKLSAMYHELTMAHRFALRRYEQP